MRVVLGISVWRVGVACSAANMSVCPNRAFPDRAANRAPSRTMNETSDNGRPDNASARGAILTSGSVGKEDSRVVRRAAISGWVALLT